MPCGSIRTMPWHTTTSPTFAIPPAGWKRPFQHYSDALRYCPNYADAHYNLALWQSASSARPKRSSTGKPTCSSIRPGPWARIARLRAATTARARPSRAPACRDHVPQAVQTARKNSWRGQFATIGSMQRSLAPHQHLDVRHVRYGAGSVGLHRSGGARFLGRGRSGGRCGRRLGRLADSPAPRAAPGHDPDCWGTGVTSTPPDGPCSTRSSATAWPIPPTASGICWACSSACVRSKTRRRNCCDLASRYRLVALSNGDRALVEHLATNNVEARFDRSLSVDSVGRFQTTPLGNTGWPRASWVASRRRS